MEKVLPCTGRLGAPRTGTGVERELLSPGIQEINTPQMPR